MDQNLEQLKYPIGHFRKPELIDNKQINEWIKQIADLPERLRLAVAKLSDEQLDTPYRPGGWTLRQVVHHLPDSHLNAYVRFKLAITEENPIIRPYHEDRWAECAEAKHAPVEVSLKLLESLHQRWVIFLQSLTPEDFDKTYIHPEHNKTFVLKEVLGLYAWHGEHHLEHILTTKKNWEK